MERQKGEGKIMGVKHGTPYNRRAEQSKAQRAIADSKLGLDMGAIPELETTVVTTNQKPDEGLKCSLTYQRSAMEVKPEARDLSGTRAIEAPFYQLTPDGLITLSLREAREYVRLAKSIGHTTKNLLTHNEARALGLQIEE
jgi:hypothetical protein